MVKMRLTRMGDKKSPFYRIVIIDSRNARDGAYIDKVGHYNPTANPAEIVVDAEKKKEVERKLFPGYVLVKVAVSPDKDNRPAMSDEAWLLIRNTRGVTGFVGPENKAIPLTDEEVIRLGVEKRSVEVSYNVGDTVNIIDEIFDGFSGVVEEIDLDNNMVKVTVSALFGKETTVELELDQVELAE